LAGNEVKKRLTEKKMKRRYVAKEIKPKKLGGFNTNSKKKKSQKSRPEPKKL